MKFLGEPVPQLKFLANLPKTIAGEIRRAKFRTISFILAALDAHSVKRRHRIGKQSSGKRSPECILVKLMGGDVSLARS